MSRWLLPLALLGCAVTALPGCLHQDQDHVAFSVAQDLAMMPRDQEAQSVLAKAKPSTDAKQLPPVKGPQERLQLPPGIPGRNAPPIVVPPLDPKRAQDSERDKVLQALYPAMPVIEEDLKPGVGPNGQPLDLPALEQIALANNPIIRQAVADVQGAIGASIQAGLCPNPNVGLEWDAIGQSGPTGQPSNGQPGGFIEQLIKTGGKLQLARSAGEMDVRNAQLALRRAQMDVMTQVRGGYFAVLVAQDNLDIAKAMLVLADEVYKLQVKRVQGGQAAPYEPLQLHVLAMQARGSFDQARNRYVSAWRQLAASLGQPELPPTQLTGHAEAAVPGYAYDIIRAHIMANNTDLGIAKNTILKSRLLLQLAQVTPIPDIDTRVLVQNDNTAAPNRAMVGVSLSIALPVWDRNQGAIQQAHAQLAKSNQDVARVENDLSVRLADAYERYRNNVTLAAYYRDSILPNQVRVYRAMYQRYQGGLPGEVLYIDLVVAQQTLAQALQTYVQNLAAQWQAIVDLAGLAQTDDLYILTTPEIQCLPPTPIAALLDSRTWLTASNDSLRIQEPVQPQTPAPRATLAPPTLAQSVRDR